MSNSEIFDLSRGTPAQIRSAPRLTNGGRRTHWRREQRLLLARRPAIVLEIKLQLRVGTGLQVRLEVRDLQMLHRTTLDSVTNLVRSDNTARRLRGGDLDQICSNRFSPSSTLWIIWPDLCQAIAATNGEKRCTRELSANGALKQIKGVGTLIALTFLLTLEDPHRFRKSREVGCYLGLQPGRRNSGQSEPQMHISKEGDPYMRTLLVQGAQHILGPFGVDCDLRRWGLNLAERGGRNAKKRAIVATARKLAVLLHHLWVSGEVYEPLHNSCRTTIPAAA